MKKVVLSVVAALAFSAAPAFAADMPVKAIKAPAAAPSPWDIAFGAAAMNDYIFRGVTQSNHRPSVSAYVEPRYNITKDIQLYIGTSFETIKFPNDARAEVDFYGGIRPTFGALALDFGVWYYYYPGGTCFADGIICPQVLPNGNFIKADLSFWEAYAKVTYTAGDFAFGPTFYYS
ncbi:MAG TPA: TorF family putative porin, partial [Pseudolabrys sp.]